MPSVAYIPTKELEQEALSWGETGGGWLAFVEEELDIAETVARNYYLKFWRKGKNKTIRESGQIYKDLIKNNSDDIESITDLLDKIDRRHHLCKVVDNYLSKRGGEEWSTKQQIEQTNVNIEAPKMDYSKLSEEDKQTLIKIRLKAKG